MGGPVGGWTILAGVIWGGDEVVLGGTWLQEGVVGLGVWCVWVGRSLEHREVVCTNH